MGVPRGTHDASPPAHLDAQGHPGVPFSHARDVGLDGPDWICLQDLGDDGRPDVLSPLPDETLASEVTALASIHAANAGDDGLSWLPRADREYARSMIEDVFWRPHWESAVRQNDFHEEFGSWLPRFEAWREDRDAAGWVLHYFGMLDL